MSYHDGRHQNKSHKTHFRSYASCQTYGCNRFRFHDAIGSETQCLCGREWQQKDLDWAQWFQQRKERMNEERKEWDQWNQTGEKQPEKETIEQQLEQIKKRVASEGVEAVGLESVAITAKPQAAPAVSTHQAFKDAETLEAGRAATSTRAVANSGPMR